VEYSSHAQRERSRRGRCSNTRSRPLRPRSRWQLPTPRLAAAHHDDAAQGRRRPFSVTRARTGGRDGLRRGEGSSDSRVGQWVVRDGVPNRSGTLCGRPGGRRGKYRQPGRLEASPGTGLPPSLVGDIVGLRFGACFQIRYLRALEGTQVSSKLRFLKARKVQVSRRCGLRPDASSRVENARSGEAGSGLDVPCPRF
jgi:hypothetical protein